MTFFTRKKKNQLKKEKISQKNDINEDTKVFKLILDDEKNDKNENDNTLVIPQKNNIEYLGNKKVDKTIEDNYELNISSIIEQLKQKDIEYKISSDEKNMLQDNFLNGNIFSKSSINLSIDNNNGFEFLDGSKDILFIEPFENYHSFGGERETCSKSEDKKLNDNEKNEFLNKKRKNENEDINESQIKIIEIMG